MTDRELMRQALEALEGLIKYNYHGKPLDEEDEAGMQAIMALREALFQPPYAASPTRKPLTDEEIYLATNMIDRGERGWAIKFARAIERAHWIGSEV